jgi:hypothetical protein
MCKKQFILRAGFYFDSSGSCFSKNVFLIQSKGCAQETTTMTTIGVALLLPYQAQYYILYYYYSTDREQAGLTWTSQMAVVRPATDQPATAAMSVPCGRRCGGRNLNRRAVDGTAGISETDAILNRVSAQEGQVTRAK